MKDGEREPKAVYLPKIRIVYGKFVRYRMSEFWVDYIRL